MPGHGKILLFKGKGIISRLIRWQTRSIYSHAAYLYPDGRTIIESWQGKGVRKKTLKNFDNVDIFAVPSWTEEDWSRVFGWCEKQLGKKYDYLSVLRFVSRRKAKHNDRFFCSELVIEPSHKINKPLLRGFPSQQSPRDLSLSPLLQLEHKPL